MRSARTGAILIVAAGLWVTGLRAAATGVENGGVAQGNDTTAATQPVAVNFDFEMQGLPVPHWSIEIEPNGEGRYRDLSSPNGGTAETKRSIRVGAATRRRLDGGFEKVGSGNCEKNVKNVANTGTKTIAYRNAAGAWVSCTFIYTEDKGLEAAATAFQAIAQTLQEGDRLEHSHRFDRLGLDAEMDELTQEIAQGEAIEIGNISPVLQSIADDERVMERVRRKAARLLEGASESSPGMN